MMLDAHFRVQCVPVAPGSYRLYCGSRLIGEAVIAGDGAFHVSHAFTGSGRVVATLEDAVAWLVAMEEAVAEPLAMA